MESNLIMSCRPSSSFSEAEIEALRRGEWQSDCLLVTLTSRNSEEGSISGPGEIFQDADRMLRVKVFVPAHPISQFELDAIQAGDLIPDASYFDVVALDMTGRMWHTKRVLIEKQDHSPGVGSIIEVAAETLWCESEIPDSTTAQPDYPKYSIRLTSFCNAKFPCNTRSQTTLTVGSKQRRQWMTMDTWTFIAADCDFELRKGNDRIDIIVRTNANFLSADQLQEHVMRSLFFCLGRPIYPATSLQRSGATQRLLVYTQQQGLSDARHKPPFDARSRAQTGGHSNTQEPHQDLVDTFMRYSLKHKNPKYLWGLLDAVYEASADRFINSWALTLSVVIESFVNSEFASLGEPSEDILLLIEKTIGQVANEATALQNSRDRLCGALRMMKNPRITDRLRVLSAEGAIVSEAPRIWNSLRNCTTHQYLNEGIDNDKFHVNLGALETMFYHVIFRAIGYRGPYSDYSERGFPLRAYPFESKASSAESDSA